MAKLPLDRKRPGGLPGVLIVAALLLGGGATGHAQSRDAGRIITVLGPIQPESLGVTLMHEHLASDMLAPDVATGYRGKGPPTAAFIRTFQSTGRYFRVPRDAAQRDFWDRSNLTSGMVDTLALGWLTRSQFVLDDREATLAELGAFRRRGGGALVDVTTVGIGRRPDRIAALSRASGVPVVMGTGWYRWMFHPPDVARATVAQLADRMVREITVGVGGSGIRAGIIGEIPVDAAGLRLDAPLSTVYSDSAIVARRTAVQARIRTGSASLESIYDPEELKVLRAAARASRRTGAAITLHAPDPWIDYLDLLTAEGADLRRVVVGHADFVLADETLARRALERGVLLQIDYTLQTYGGHDVGPFEETLDRIAWAVKAGYGDQLLVSLDLCFRQGLSKYGGGGYLTLFDRIVPGLRARGLSDRAIDAILIDNPRRVLTLAAPKPA